MQRGRWARAERPARRLEQQVGLPVRRYHFVGIFRCCRRGMWWCAAAARRA